MQIRSSLRTSRVLRGLAISLLAAHLAACGPAVAPGSPLRIEISHVVADAPLQLDGGTYRTAAGDEFTVHRLRYYLSNFRLHRKDGSWYTQPRNPQTSEGYFLIDGAVPASAAFELSKVPAGEYDGVEFLIGVDEARNTAGAQTGTLDPARGLFWTWKSGYIFFQLEGRSPQSTLDDHAYSFHIGGAGTPAMSRTVYLPLAPKPARVETRVLPIIHLHADLAGVFQGAHEIRLAKTNSVMDAAAGLPIADNLAGIFSVDHLHHEPRAAP